MQKIMTVVSKSKAKQVEPDPRGVATQEWKP
jgi:hypothetical protein